MSFIMKTSESFVYFMHFLSNGKCNPRFYINGRKTRDKVILDLGCGYGNWLKSFKGNDTIGIDINVNAIKIELKRHHSLFVMLMRCLLKIIVFQ